MIRGFRVWRGFAEPCGSTALCIRRGRRMFFTLEGLAQFMSWGYCLDRVVSQMSVSCFRRTRTMANSACATKPAIHSVICPADAIANQPKICVAEANRNQQQNTSPLTPYNSPAHQSRRRWPIERSAQEMHRGSSPPDDQGSPGAFPLGIGRGIRSVQLWQREVSGPCEVSAVPAVPNGNRQVLKP